MSIKRLAGWLVAMSALMLVTACSGEEKLSFLDPQGPVAAAEASHFWLVTGILFVLVTVPVYVGLILILWRYRYGRWQVPYMPGWKFYRPLEYFTWFGPIVIVAFLSVLVWGNTARLDPYRSIQADSAALQVQVVGFDWKWLFIYPQLGIASVGLLAFPAGRPLALQLSTASVMQSFFIPALGSQIYAMGGMVTQLNLQADRPGLFLGENTMYSGMGFHEQRFIAQAMSSADFDAWQRNVQQHGMPLDAAALAALDLQNTRTQLRQLLPQAASGDGHVYFRQVPSGLFERIVQAMQRGDALTSSLPAEHGAPHS